MAEHNDLGKAGEQLAAEYLIRKGYEIVERNWHYQKAEVDIIARLDNTLAVIEVKTRSTSVFGDPQDAVQKKKINLLIQAIDHFVEVNDLDVEVRFDIIAIVKNKTEEKLEHLEDAFFHF